MASAEGQEPVDRYFAFLEHGVVNEAIFIWHNVCLTVCASARLHGNLTP
jgi:hypothetical protein